MCSVADDDDDVDGAWMAWSSAGGPLAFGVNGCTDGGSSLVGLVAVLLTACGAPDRSDTVDTAFALDFLDPSTGRVLFFRRRILSVVVVLQDVPVLCEALCC